MNKLQRSLDIISVTVGVLLCSHVLVAESATKTKVLRKEAIRSGVTLKTTFNETSGTVFSETITFDGHELWSIDFFEDGEWYARADSYKGLRVLLSYRKGLHMPQAIEILNADEAFFERLVRSEIGVLEFVDEEIYRALKVEERPSKGDDPIPLY